MKYIEMCPDFKSECIGSKCAAYIEGIQMIKNATPLLFKFNYKFDVAIPLIIHVDIKACQKYNKFIDKESAEIYDLLMLDFEEVNEPLDGENL